MISNYVTRLLNSKKITYQTFVLPVEKLGAIRTAALLGVPVQQVFKSIVITRNKPGKNVLCIIPGDCTADLKKISKFLNEKKLTIPTLNEAERITGLLAGGISPLALINKGFQILLDSKANTFSEIHISGGQRGLNIKIGVLDLINLTHAKLVDISQPIIDNFITV
jgi:Cys-tRNA(Pro)/Cys-tRNA(Cys) deacylase